MKDSVTWPPDDQIKQNLPQGFKHVFFIRDPTLMFTSYRKAKYKQHTTNANHSGEVLEESKFDLEKHTVSPKSFHYFKYMHELWGLVRENIDPNPIVINSQDLLDDPKRVLSRFCELTGLPYKDSLLHWEASTDVVKSWKAAGDTLVQRTMMFYHRAITSSEFMPSKEPVHRDHLTEDVIRLAEASFPYYNEMNQQRLSYESE